MTNANKRMLGLVLPALMALTAPARALDSSGLGGHVALGYSRLFISDSPGGSLSVGAGVDFPALAQFRIGADVGFALLGSRSIRAGTQAANLDYSLLEVSLLAHWQPPGLGPITRVSFGPALMSARAELSTSGGGLAFTGFAIEKVAPGAALEVTLMKGSSLSPVAAGLGLGVHAAFLGSESWTVTSLMLEVHY